MAGAAPEQMAIERLMAASDLIVTKREGLTTSEGLAMRRPMILLGLAVAATLCARRERPEANEPH